MLKRNNSSTRLLSRPKRNGEDKLRSIDEFYAEAGEMDITPKASQYWIMLVAMGMAQLSDATSILNMNFILSDEGFSKDILKGDFAFRGSMLAGCVFGGMLVGGVLVCHLEIYNTNSNRLFLLLIFNMFSHLFVV